MEILCEEVKEKDTDVTRYKNILFTTLISCKINKFRTTIQTVKDQWDIGLSAIDANHIKDVVTAKYNNFPKHDKTTPLVASFVADIVNHVAAHITVSGKFQKKIQSRRTSSTTPTQLSSNLAKKQG